MTLNLDFKFTISLNVTHYLAAVIDIAWVQGPGWLDHVSGYSGICFEIKCSGKHGGFNGVLFKL